jgi:hypothetical protein
MVALSFDRGDFTWPRTQTELVVHTGLAAASDTIIASGSPCQKPAPPASLKQRRPRCIRLKSKALRIPSKRSRHFGRFVSTRLMRQKTNCPPSYSSPASGRLARPVRSPLCADEMTKKRSQRSERPVPPTTTYAEWRARAAALLVRQGVLSA